MERVAGIEAGVECERLEPLVSALADGEATAQQLASARPHLRTCLACRARLREFRAAPRRVAALLPPLALAATDGGVVRGWVESVVGAVQHKTAALSERAHSAAELALGQKVAAVAASTAAIAGGGAGVHELADEADRAPPEAPATAVEPVRIPEPPSPAATTPGDPPTPSPLTAPARGVAVPQLQPPAAPQPARPDAATEFAPGDGPTAGAASVSRAPSGGGSSGGGSGGGGEFAP